MDNTATIKFNDGTEINVEKNATTYIVDTQPDFSNDLKNVKIISSEGVTIISNARIQECACLDDRYWFTIVERTAEDIQNEKTMAAINYLALLNNIDPIQ